VISENNDMDKDTRVMDNIIGDSKKTDDELTVVINSDKYKFTKIEPVLVTNIIDKSSETNTGIIITDLRPEYLIALESGYNFISNSISFIVPLILISSIISFITTISMGNNSMGGPANNVFRSSNYRPHGKQGRSNSNNTPFNPFTRENENP
jgi:hypothetical protein